MSRKRNCVSILILLFIILSITVGYAYLSSNLVMIGNVTVKKYDPSRYLYNEIISQNKENGLMVLDNQASTYVSASTGIDFGVAPSDTNGKGVYVRNGTENDTYPVYYYRGDITNNNVVFAGFCWKMVRTTETGGIKLIYNGLYEHSQTRMIERDEYINIIDDTSSYSYNDTNKNWNIEKELPGNYIIKFSVANVGNYILNFEISSDMSNYYFYLNDVQVGRASGGNGGQPGHINLGNLTLSDVISIKFEKDEETIDVDTLSFNIEAEEKIFNCNNTGEASQIGMSYFNANYEAYNAYVGYMYGTPNSSNYEEEHLSTKDSTSSTIKTVIDTWYSTNMTNYTSLLEDTLWCNDRSFASDNNGEGVGNSDTNYVCNERLGPTVTNIQPKLQCTNQNDRFTVNETIEGRVNGNGALTYPVALLTADEVTLAGNGWYGYSDSSYLSSGQKMWTLSPAFVEEDMGSSVFLVDMSGYLQHGDTDFSGGVRPSVSLATGAKISNIGDGSVNNPFVVQ